MSDNSDKIIRLYSRLDSLKQNLPEYSSIDEKYVRKYHSIVQDIEDTTKLDLKEFKIAEGETKHLMGSSNYLTGEVTYTKERYCERNFLLAKLDAILSYFQIKYLSQEKPEIGFKPR